jgi:hypothetical protein
MRFHGGPADGGVKGRQIYTRIDSDKRLQGKVITGSDLFVLLGVDR